jgi:hypothetical protein
MNQNEAVVEARAYLYESFTVLSSEVKGEVNSYRLHHQLQFLLCRAYQRLARKIGEASIVPKDIHLLVESWIMSQGTSPFHAIGLVSENYTGD